MKGERQTVNDSTTTGTGVDSRATDPRFSGTAPAGPERDAALLAADAATGVDPLADPGFVTFAGDWHGDTAFARQVVDLAPAGPSGVRVVLQLGDFGVWPGQGGADYLDALAVHLERTNGVLLFVDGNHEDHVQLNGFPLRPDGLRVLRPRLYHLPRGFRWRWHGRTWLALGGAHSIDRNSRTEGVDWWPGETPTAEEFANARTGGPADYMVTHDAPAGVSIRGIRDPEIGQPKQLFEELVIEAEYRRLLREVVDTVRPSWLLHGHYHTRHEALLDLGGGQVCTVAGMAKTSGLAENTMTLDLRTHPGGED